MSGENLDLNMDLLFVRPEPETEPETGDLVDEENLDDEGQRGQRGLKLIIESIAFEIDTGVDEFPSELGPFEPQDDDPTYGAPDSPEKLAAQREAIQRAAREYVDGMFFRNGDLTWRHPSSS